MKTEIIKLIHGSKLYGVSTKDSDTDIKSIYIVDEAKDLYDGVSDPKCSNNNLEGSAREEYEEFYIKRFAQLLYSGQTVAIEMLFAPPKYWLTFRPSWEILYNNREQLVSKNIAPFVKYSRSQSYKYSIKGARLKTLKTVLDDIKNMQILNWSPKTVIKELEDRYKSHEGVRFYIDTSRGSTVQMIEVCGKSFGETTNLKLWIEPLENLLASFGNRSEEAMLNNGDLKAMYHSVRILGETIELLEHKTITLPRPNADYLMKIRSGLITFEEVSEVIDRGIEKIDKLLITNTLPDNPDRDYINNWAWQTQKQELINSNN